MRSSLVITGVAGCGKSSLGQAVALAQGLSLIEGDDFHSADNRAKMKEGTALTDADRAGWLDTLAQQLAARPQGVVLTCSALKRAYRNRLRQAAMALCLALMAASVFINVVLRYGFGGCVAASEELSYSPWIVTVSKKYWDQLSKDEQKILSDAAKTSRDFERKDTRDEASKAMSNLKDKGMQINEPSPAESARMRDKLTKVYALIAADVGMDLWNDTQAELKKIRAGK